MFRKKLSLFYVKGSDPGERYPLNITSNPDLEKVVEDILRLRDQLEAQIVWKESEMAKGQDRMASPCCNKSPTCEPYPSCCNCNQ